MHRLGRLAVCLATALPLAAGSVEYWRGQRIAGFQLINGNEEWGPQIRKRVTDSTWKIDGDHFIYKPGGGAAAVHGSVLRVGSTYHLEGQSLQSSTAAVALTALIGNLTRTKDGAEIFLIVSASAGMAATVNNAEFSSAVNSGYQVTLRLRRATAAEIRTFEETDDRGNPRFRFGRIRDTSYAIRLVGRTSSGGFQVDGLLAVEDCANPDATYAGGRHPIDLVIKTEASAISSGVRGAVYFVTNSNLTRWFGGAAHVVNARVNGCSVRANAASGRVAIDIDPGFALGVPLNVVTLDSGLLAIGKQITGGGAVIQFDGDRVAGAIRFLESGGRTYEAAFTGTAIDKQKKTAAGAAVILNSKP